MRTAIAKRIKQTAPAQPTRKAQMLSFAAPSRGWIRNENLAAGKPAGATVLDNFVPLATGARLRKGSDLYATVGSGDRVGAIITYTTGATSKLFVANENNIYDVTTVADETVSPAATVTGLANGDWQWVQFTTTGGTFIRAVNGADTPLIYDGSSWGTTPAISASGLTDSDLSHVWAFKNRLFFVEGDTFNAWYLPVDSISGTAVKLPLGGEFTLGGSLYFGATWSVDAGDGMDEKCVFISTEGEVVIFGGTDPSSASTWGKVGNYRIGKPLGPRAIVKGGGDLAIATDIGLIPLSKAVQIDKAAIGAQAISYAIEEEWKAEVAQRVGIHPWHVEMWPTGQIAIVAMPSYSSLPHRCFVANLRTGAWSRFTGWDTHCLGLFQDRMFFGTEDGLVIEAEVGGSDQGDAYTCTYVGLFSDCGRAILPKQPTLMRPVYVAAAEVGDKVSVAYDYTVTLPTAPDAASVTGGANTWDNGLWNQAIWQAGVETQTFQFWRAPAPISPGVGFALAPIWMVTLGQESEPDVQLVRIDMQFEIGDAPG